MVTVVQTSWLYEERLLAMKGLENLSKVHLFELRHGLSCILADILTNNSSISIETTRLCMDILKQLLILPGNGHERIEHELNNHGKMYYESNLRLKPLNLSFLLIGLLSSNYNEYCIICYSVIQILTILLYKNTQNEIRHELGNIFGIKNTHNNDNSTNFNNNNNRNIYLKQPTIVLLTHLCTNNEFIQKKLLLLTVYLTNININSGVVYKDDNRLLITGDTLWIVCQRDFDSQFTQLSFSKMCDQFDSDKDYGIGSRCVIMDNCKQINSSYVQEHVAEQFSPNGKIFVM